MKMIKNITGVFIHLIIGVLYSPLLIIAITDILGTAKGPAYTIAEPELSAYRAFGIFLIIFLVIILVAIESLLNKYLYKSEKRYLFINLTCMLITIFVVIPF